MQKLLAGVVVVLVTGCSGLVGPMSGEQTMKGSGGGAGGGGMSTTGTPDSGTMQPPDACGNMSSSIVPLFAAGPAESGPIVTIRADGVIVTTGAGRVRPRHEREDRHMHFESHYFEHRSYAWMIEDFTALGMAQVKFTYYPIAEPSVYGPTTNFRCWKVYGPQGNGPSYYTFADNTTLTFTADKQGEKVITTNARENNRPLQSGDILEFEFGIFIMGFDSRDPDTIGDGAKSYYTDTFRYQVGKGGLTPETFDTTGLVGPTLTSARLGGDTTVPHIAWADGTPVVPEMAFSQLALNMQSPHQQTFLEGRRLFHTEFDTGDHTEPDNPVFTEQAGKLGPMFNVKSCDACHINNGRGVLPAVGQPVNTVAFKLYDNAQYGTQLQPQEAVVTLGSYETHDVTLADGMVVTLKKPIFTMPDGVKPSARLPRQLVGLGLLEAIDEQTILARADEHDCNGDGISGRPNLVKDPVTGQLRVGRFGWKAEKVSVTHQVSDALNDDLGVTTTMFPGGGTPELSDDDVNRLSTYMRLLGVLPQRNSDDAQVQRGEQVFQATGCSMCHIPYTTTGDTHPYQELRHQTIRPFTDLLLHDLGPDLADGTGRPEAQEWRTAPLWGVGYTQQVSGAVHLLNDGRAGSVLEAVLWHGGEAKRMRDAVVGMSTADREALIAFVSSL